MAKIKSEFNSNYQEELIDRFVRLQLKELYGEELTQDQTSFLAKIELATAAVPGVLEETLLEYGLCEIEDMVTYRIAAASFSENNSIYNAVQNAIQDQKSTFSINLETGQLDILQIHISEGIVEPCYQEGYTFIIERAKFGQQTVGKYGGIFIAIDDLRKMALEYDLNTKSIRLYEK